MIKFDGVDISNQVVLNEFAILVLDKIVIKLVHMEVIDIEAIKMESYAEICKKYPQKKIQLNIPEKKDKKPEEDENESK